MGGLFLQEQSGFGGAGNVAKWVILAGPARNSSATYNPLLHMCTWHAHNSVNNLATVHKSTIIRSMCVMNSNKGTASVQVKV